jgi:hypothetical protein
MHKRTRALQLLALLALLMLGEGCAEYGYKLNELYGLNCRPEALQNGHCVRTTNEVKR